MFGIWREAVEELAQGSRRRGDDGWDQNLGWRCASASSDPGHLERDWMARYGIQVEGVADLVETVLNGLEVTDMWETDSIMSVLLRLPENCRQDAETIQNLPVDVPFGQGAPFFQIARIEREEGPQTIFRENQMCRKTILCSVLESANRSEPHPNWPEFTGSLVHW